MKGSYMPDPDRYLASLHDDYSDFEPQPPRWRRILKKVIVLILLILTALAGYMAYNIFRISEQPLAMAPLLTDGQGRTNVLLLGVGDPGHEGQKLSDTNMVLVLDRGLNKAATISLPRDLRVRIPGYGFAKLNQANALGGDELAAETVSETLDIPIHYTVTTNFSGLKELVDAVGGVEVTNDERLYDPEYPCENNQYRSCGYTLEPGTHRLNGTEALRYVRCRKGTCGNDFGRAERQQEVLSELREKLTSPEVLAHPVRLAAVTAALRNNLQTTMGPAELARFGQLWQKAQKNNPVSLVLSTAPGGMLTAAGGSSDLVPIGGTYSAIRVRIDSIFETPQGPGPRLE